MLARPVARALGRDFGRETVMSSAASNPPSLVLDFVGDFFASDPSGWAEAYAVGGERPTMLLEFTTGEYGA